jgi:phage terminase Nu1 subunit (DNA packaging protein)
VAEDLITQKEFAELLGVTTRTVFNLREAGLSEHCQVLGRDVRIRMPAGLQWYVRWKEAEAAARETPTSLQSLEEEYAKLRNEEKRLDVDRKKAKLVEMVKVDLWAGDMLARVASRLDALPLRIAQGVNGKTLAERRKQATALVNEVREEVRLGPVGELLDEEDAA